MAWTDERIALLKQYWGEGRSASQIAETLGEGLTRNAVIGKAHRLGLASRPSPLKSADTKAEGASAKPPKPAARAKAKPQPAEPAAATVRPSAPKVAEAPPPVVAPVAPKPVATPAAPPVAVVSPPVAAARPRAKGAKVTLLDLNDRICKWPIGHPDEADFHFCGQPVSTGFPYCAEHCLVAYQAQMPRRDRPAGQSRPFGPNLPRPR